jgi:hypothetical protein
MIQYYFTLHFWGLFILGLPMETVRAVQLFFSDEQSACGIYSSGQVEN